MATQRKKTTPDEKETQVVPHSTERNKPVVTATPANEETKDPVMAENERLKAELEAIRAEQEQFRAMLVSMQNEQQGIEDDGVDHNQLDRKKPHQKTRGPEGVWYEQGGRRFNAAGVLVETEAN